jgi:cbb3-type cytochrome oxidase cytochrome c subunit
MKANVIREVVLVGAMLLLLGTAPVLLGGAPLVGQERDPRATRGEQVFVSQGCYGCHLIGKFGTPIGPELSRVGAKYPASYLRQWLRDPESVRPTAHMPKLELTLEDIDALAVYLASLK